MALRRAGLLAAVLVLLSATVIGAMPSHAAPILGTGLVRMDGSWATVKTLGNGDTVLTLNKSASGQWMGEIGRSLVPGVRALSDKDLIDTWDQLGHAADDRVTSTLTWNDLTNVARLSLGAPQLSPRGHLRFLLEKADDLPARMENVTVNISRSDSATTRQFPVIETTNTTATSAALATIQGPYIAEIALQNLGVSCYSVALTQSAPSATFWSIACGNVTFAGGTLAMTPPTVGQLGTVVLRTTIDASGTAFPYSGVIAQWPVSALSK
ncbi:MAG: hypothetical protein WAO50_00225 [Candidatus Nanopelagicales bacterium]